MSQDKEVWQEDVLFIKNGTLYMLCRQKTYQNFSELNQLLFDENLEAVFYSKGMSVPLLGSPFKYKIDWKRKKKIKIERF